MIKALFIFGTRPEAIKMAPVIREFKQNRAIFKTRICVTAQHRQMLDQVLNLFKIKPDYDLDLMRKNQSLPDLTARVLLGVTDVIEKEKPDLVFVQGDTTTVLAASLAAFYSQVPVAHIEAGLRTQNKYSPFPEEINRRLASVVSDFHFAPTAGAKKNLIREGIKESSIYVTGNTVIDALEWVLSVQNKESARQKWLRWFLEEHGISFPDRTRTILVTGHRRESFGEGFQRICRALKALAKNNNDIQIVYPVHLNPHVQKPVYSILGEMDNIHLIPPIDYEPFVFLMNRSHLILTDSGGIQEEAPTLGVPVLVMRDTSERPEGIKAGSAKLVSTDVNRIVKETQKLLDSKAEYRRLSNVKNPYGDGQASKRIARVILKNHRRLS